MEEFVVAHEIQDASRVNLRFKSGGKAELDKSQLRRTVSIGANGNPAASFLGEPQ